MPAEKMDLLERTFDEVLDATKHLDDKIGRLLTSVAFLTAATLALAALGAAKYLEFDFDVRPVRLPLILLAITVHLLGVFVAVLLLLAGLAAPLGVPGVTNTPATNPGGNAAAPAIADDVRQPVSQLWFLRIAATTPEQWQSQWDANLWTLKRERESDLLRESQNLARRTTFKADRISEAVAVLSFSILAFATAVIFMATANAAGKPPVHIGYACRISIGILFGLYFFLQLALPARHARQLSHRSYPWRLGFAVSASLMVSLILAYEHTSFGAEIWGALVIILAVAALVCFARSTVGNLRCTKILVMIFTVTVVCLAAIICGVEGKSGYYVGQLGAVVLSAFALLISSLLSPTIALRRHA
ncbi:hypothetical protein P9869_33470 [Streptomyces ossamyceticus]|nr:hypothetical protein [Streptomyces ossamyceticus]